MIDLSMIKPGMQTALLIRHAERNPAVEKVHDIIEPLNENGEKIAVELGEKLRPYAKNLRIFSSPVGRCIQTAKAILQGFGEEENIIESTYLGEPGPFVIDREKGLIAFTKLYSCHKVVEMQCNNESLDGFRSKKDGAEYLANFVCSQLKESDLDTILIFISHDACLAPVLSYFTGEIFRKGYWLDFLDGAIIQQSDEKCFFERNGKSYEIEK